MYSCVLRLTFPDKTAKAMVVTYMKHVADDVGFEKYGVVMRFAIDTSDTELAIALIFKDKKSCEADGKAQRNNLVSTWRSQGVNVVTFEGEIGSVKLNPDFVQGLLNDSNG